MPPMITPSVVANGSSAPSSAAQAGQRGRGADDAQGASFGAALDRSRAGSRNASATPKDGAAPAADIASADRKTARRPGIDDDTKDAPLPADPNLAFLAPANTPLHALTLAGRAGAQAARGTDASGTATVAGAADAPLETAVQDPQAKPLPDGAALSADAKAAPDAAKAADLHATAKDTAAAKPGTPASQPAADAAPAMALHDIASAAVAAQTIAVGATRPATAAGAPAGTAASGRASARTTASATTAEQLAGAAQSKASAEDTKAAALPAAATAAGTGGDDAQSTATPIAVQQAATVTAPAERSADTSQATRPGAHTIAPEVGSEKWAPALGQQLARMSTTGHHTAELNLNPAGLGPLKVTLSIGDNQAQAMFVSAHESVRKAVEAALPQLRNSLSEQGITLGQASVGAETRQSFGQDAAFAQQNQQQQQSARQQGAPAYPGAGRAGSVAAEPSAPARASVAGSNARSGVDTFA